MLFENKKLSECGFNDKKSMGWMKVLLKCKWSIIWEYVLK